LEAKKLKVQSSKLKTKDVGGQRAENSALRIRGFRD
jgi:hypothetical protein